VDGPALGGGAGIAAAADLVIASPRATFALPETLLGLIPAAAFPPIARRVGVARARRLALGAPPLDAEEARLAGLADQVAVDLEAAADAHVRRFARLDPRAVGAMKTLVARHFAAPPAYAADARAAFVALLGSEATAGRIRRFAAGLAPWADDEDEGEGEGEGGE
jgi:enoyl-CoA hydratase/carnithine racemase